MAWSYIPLWKLLLDKRMKRTDLYTAAKIFPNTLAKMGRDETVSMDALGRICEALDCRLEDIVEYVPEKEEAAQ